MSTNDSLLRNIFELSKEHYKYNDLLLKMYRDGEDIFSRHNVLGHVTASACLLSKDLSQVLMIDSPKFGRLLLPGGHIDAGELPVVAALRELQEECGVASASVVPLVAEPVTMNVHWIAENPARNEPRHLHFDVHVLFASLKEELEVSLDMREATGFGWYGLSSLMVSYPELYKHISEVAYNG